MTGARKFMRLQGPFNMRRGVIQSPTIAYETWGRLNAERSNAILMFTGLSPSAHAASSAEDPSPGWWEKMIGSGRPIDTNRYFVVCPNSLGSCFGSTGPATINPETGDYYRLTFPTLTIEDVASAGYWLMRHLGVNAVHTVIGASMGGLSALAFSVLFPRALNQLISISSSAQAWPFAIGLRSIQREIIRQDPDWNQGQYPLAEGPVNGMRTARKLGMLTYRSAREMQHRFGRRKIPEMQRTGGAFGPEFEVESYLQEHAMRFVNAFDPNCYLYLSRAMDLFDIADHGGSLTAGISRVGASRVLVIGVETDLLFPIHQQQQLAEELAPGREVQFHALPSLQGHDAFLVDMEHFGPLVGDFLRPSGTANSR